MSPASASAVTYFRDGAKSIEEKLPDLLRRCGTGSSARLDQEELSTCAGDAGRLTGLAVPAAPMKRRGFANEIGEAESSSLYLVFGRSLSGSSGFEGVLAREGRDDIE